MLRVIPKILPRTKNIPILQIFRIRYQINIIKNTNKFITIYYNKYYNKIAIKYTLHFLYITEKYKGYPKYKKYLHIPNLPNIPISPLEQILSYSITVSLSPITNLDILEPL